MPQNTSQHLRHTEDTQNEVVYSGTPKLIKRAGPITLERRGLINTFPGNNLLQYWCYSLIISVISPHVINHRVTISAHALQGNFCASKTLPFVCNLYAPLPPNQSISITVEFSDELLLSTSGRPDALPTISLNNGDEAVLVGGTGTRWWFFSYDFKGDDGTDVPVLDIANDSLTAINCTSGCRAWNWNGAPADLSVRTFTLVFASPCLIHSSPRYIIQSLPMAYLLLFWRDRNVIRRVIDSCSFHDSRVVRSSGPYPVHHVGS